MNNVKYSRITEIGVGPNIDFEITILCFQRVDIHIV